MLPTAPATHWEPDRPSALTGRGFIASSVGLGALGWGLTFAQIGLLRGCPARIDGDVELSANACLFEADGRMAALGGLRALTNVSNWGIAGTAGAIRGNYEAIDHVWTNRAPRRSGLWIGGGIGLALAGMTTGAVATGMAYGGTCPEARCLGNLAGYLVAQQAAQTMFTAGVGMAAYGMVYRYEYADNHAYKNRMASSLRAAPAVSANYAGASLSGRF